jgi:oxygen-independent coproporphyrinogen-3 oxidase
MDRYVAALRRELDWVLPGTALAHLFVGGGTPTALPADLLREVLSAVFGHMNTLPGAVHTVEASPESITESHLRVLIDHGVGRVSMGIESMDDSVLETVRRRHTAEQALAACRRIAASDLALNVDLIYGLPGQTQDGFRRDLEAVVTAGATSVCLYALRLNSNTPVADQLGASEHFDLARLMRWRAFVARSAAELGLSQTHPFTFKRRHDESPPRRQPRTTARPDLLGLGMAARSQLGDTMYRNHERFSAYVDRLERGRSPVEALFRLDQADRKTQYIADTLTDRRPLQRRAYRQAFGTSIDDDFDEILGRLRAAELISDDGDIVSLTDTGSLVYDRILLCFYPVRAVRWLRDHGEMLRRGAPPVPPADERSQ